LVDVPETESLGFPTLDQLQQFTGATHISNKKIISSETGAIIKDSSAYSQPMPELLATINLQLVAGVNVIVLHGSPYSGNYPGTTWPGYMTFNYTVTEMHSKCQLAWNTYKYAMDCIVRNCMISQRMARIDIAFLTSTNAFFTFPLTVTTSISSAGKFLYHFIHP